MVAYITTGNKHALITFIDHENRCVFNGSRLGKEYSANAFNERYGAGQKSGVDLHKISETFPQEETTLKKEQFAKIESQIKK